MTIRGFDWAENEVNKFAAATWGVILYRAAATFAGLIALLVLLNFVYNLSEGEPRVPIAASGVAAIIWLIGLFCRHLFGDPDIDWHSAQH
jgi:hypothetical protein